MYLEPSTTVSLSSPSNNILVVSYEIHLVSSVSLVNLRVDGVCIMSYLAKSFFFLDIYIPFKTLSMGYFNVVFDYCKLVGATTLGLQVNNIYEFHATPFNIYIPCFIVLFVIHLTVE
ncbi:hypothetical protein Bca4012_020494 [Brassica carinata]